MCVLCVCMCLSALAFVITGSELKSWLLFYSLPVLKGILPQPYYSHYTLLVASVHMLTSDYIVPGELDLCEQWLRKFYKDYMELYGNYLFVLHAPSHQCIK